MTGEQDGVSAFARRRAAGALLAIVASLAAFVAGCAGDGASAQTNEPAPSAASKKGSRERELDLVVPETGTAPEDLTKLDEATLDNRIAQANRRVNELTGQVFLHAASATDGDLARDATYRMLLLKTKTAEAELDRLEQEKARRATK